MKFWKIIKYFIFIVLITSIFNNKIVFAQEIDIDSTVINDKKNNNNKVKADDNQIFTKENYSKEVEYKKQQKIQKNESINKIFNSKPKNNVVVKQLFQKKENFDVFKSKNKQDYQYLIYILTAVVTSIVVIITHKYYLKKRRKNENSSNDKI